MYSWALSIIERPSSYFFHLTLLEKLACLFVRQRQFFFFPFFCNMSENSTKKAPATTSSRSLNFTSDPDDGEVSVVIFSFFFFFSFMHKISVFLLNSLNSLFL